MGYRHPSSRHPDVDRKQVVARVIVHLALGVVITGIYVAVVGGLGQLIGGDQPDTALAITATALVAVGFQPLRRRVQRVVDRLVSGRTATPHEVLAEFSRRVAATDDSRLGLVAKSLVEGTAATRVGVWVNADGQLVETTAWPTDPITDLDADSVSDTAVDGHATEPPAPDDGDVTSLPITHDGIAHGAITLAVAGGQQLTEKDLVLAGRVASGMGLALGNRARTQTLETRVEELRQSRRRLVAVLDDTRRQLERDLHDGAQQQLVALKVKLALAQRISHGDGASETAAVLAEMTAAADVTVEEMRNFARGLYPPLLEAEGLGPAIRMQARQAPIAVTVDIGDLGRYDRQVETTVNLCVIEALDNVARHARAATTTISVAQHNGSIVFSVRDDGVGFDTDRTRPGVGITHMADRIDAVAGAFSVESAPGRGTTVAGTVPVDQEAAP